MLEAKFSARAARELRLMAKRGYDIAKFQTILCLLLQNHGMPQQYGDHPLKGDWSGCRECHIAPDWLLIYRIDEGASMLILMRTGTHADLFSR